MPLPTETIAVPTIPLTIISLWYYLYRIVHRHRVNTLANNLTGKGGSYRYKQSARFTGLLLQLHVMLSKRSPPHPESGPE